MTPGFRVAQFMAAVFAVTAVNAFMPLWFADRGLSPAAIGQVLGFASLFRVMSGPGWGTLADRVGRCDFRYGTKSGASGHARGAARGSPAAQCQSDP